ncbi:unnamed protein product, partial [Polarella glacialis]
DAQLEELEVIGQGSYGTVYRVRERATGRTRVMKSVVRPESWNQDRLRMEGDIMKHLDHPHIMRIFSWFENGDTARLVMEYCTGGEILSAIRKGRANGETMKEGWASTAVRQTFQALAYLHAKGVVHKDLKGENILLLHDTMDDKGKHFGNEPHVVVCDLGTAEVV